MAEQKRLVVQVRADGSVHAETFGMYGQECLDHITALEDLLEATTTSSSYTEDYFRVAHQAGAEVTDRDHA